MPDGAGLGNHHTVCGTHAVLTTSNRGERSTAGRENSVRGGKRYPPCEKIRSQVTEEAIYRALTQPSSSAYSPRRRLLQPVAQLPQSARTGAAVTPSSAPCSALSISCRGIGTGPRPRQKRRKELLTRGLDGISPSRSQGKGSVRQKFM